MYNKNRLFNPRMLVMLAAGLVSTIAAVNMFVASKYFEASLCVVFFVLLLVVCSNLYEKTGRKLVAAAAILVSSVVALGLCGIQAYIYDKQADYSGYNLVQIECYVESQPVIYDELIVFDAKLVTVGGKPENSSCVVYITLSENTALENLSAGNGLKLKAKIYKRALTGSDGINSSICIEGRYYNVSAAESGVIVNNAIEPDFGLKARLFINGLLHKNLPQDQADFAAALLIGEKSFSETQIESDIQISGLAHVMTVSGLHVGFLTAVLIWLASKLNAGRYISIGVIFALLGFYAYICGFTAPIMRACITGLLSLVAVSFGFRPDPLNNLAVAVLLIACINPFYILTLSFILSFSCALSIILFARPISNLLKYIKLPGRLSENIAMSTSTAIGLLPVLVYAFRAVSVYNIFSNLIALPVVMVAFVLLTIVVPIVALIPVFDVVLVPIGLLLQLIIVVAGFVSSLNYAEFVVFGGLAVFIVYYLCLFLPNRYSLLRGKMRKLVAAACLTVLLIVFSIANIPERYSANSIYLFDQPASNAVMFTAENNKTILISDLSKRSINKTEEFLISRKTRKLDVLVLYNASGADLTYIKRFVLRYNVNRVFVLNNDSAVEDGLAEFGLDVVSLTKEGAIYPYVKLKSENTGAICVELGGKKILYLCGSANISATALSGYDYLLSSFSNPFPGVNNYFQFQTGDNVYGLVEGDVVVDL